MKKLLIIYAALFLWSAAQGQTKLNETKIEKYGVQAISLPQNSKKVSETEETRQNDDLSWMDFYQNYRILNGKDIQDSMEVTLSIQVWNADFSKVSGRKPELDMPEKLMDFELAANAKQITPNGIGINAMNYHQIDGAKGILTKGTTGENRVRIVWHVLRYFEKKPQNISISASCKKDDLPEALKIIDSIKLQK
jgi:hypothetical protein